MVMSTEYAKIVAVQRRHDGWPHAIDGPLGMLENRREWLLAEASSMLKRWDFAHVLLTFASRLLHVLLTF